MSKKLNIQPAAKSLLLLTHVWNHIHGMNMDGARRPWPGDKQSAENWNALRESIGMHLESCRDKKKKAVRLKNLETNPR